MAHSTALGQVPETPRRPPGGQESRPAAADAFSDRLGGDTAFSPRRGDCHRRSWMSGLGDALVPECCGRIHLSPRRNFGVLPLGSAPLLLVPAPQFNLHGAMAPVFSGAGSLFSGNDSAATVALLFSAGQSFENPPGRCSRLQRPFLNALERELQRVIQVSLAGCWTAQLAAKTTLSSGWSCSA